MRSEKYRTLSKLFFFMYLFDAEFEAGVEENEEVSITHKAYKKYFTGKNKEIDVLLSDYLEEIDEFLYTTDQKGREVHIYKNMYILHHSEFFEIKKNDLREIFERRKFEQQPKRNGILYELFIALYEIESAIKDFCYDHDINFNKLVSKFNKRYEKTYPMWLYDMETSTMRIHDMESLMIYVKGKTNVTETEQSEITENKSNEFKELFTIPYNDKTDVLKEILRSKTYIDEHDKWIGKTNKNNELSVLYYLLKEHNIFQPSNKVSQLKIFYKEFGLTVFTDNEPKGDIHIRNISNSPSPYTDTYKTFERLFISWIK